MTYHGLWVLVLGVSVVQAPSIHQQTEWWCSPTIGQTGGNVTMIMNCQGVDPRAMDALNKELGLTKGQLRLTEELKDQMTRKADEYARKYYELLRRSQATQDKQLGRQAETLVREGKLKEADTLLRQPPAITTAQYQAIQPGISYQQVIKILGRPGEEAGRSEGMVSYIWKNADFSMLVVVFIDGRVHSMAPSGLR
jgi:hypothetical protein